MSFNSQIQPGDGAAAGLAQRLSAALSEAMKRRDASATAALRSALAAIANAEAVESDDAQSGGGGAVEHSPVGVGATEVTRRRLTEEDVRTILEREIRERADAVLEYRRMGQDNHAAQAEVEAGVLRGFLVQPSRGGYGI